MSNATLTPVQRRNRRLAVLKRRRDFLADRITNYRGKNASRDKAELAALSWAIQVVQAAKAEGVIDDLEKTVVARNDDS